jgi:predicted nucleic acid-binding protein
VTIFLETSALLRTAFGQTGAEDVARELHSATRIVASRLLRVETERAVHRIAIEQPVAEAQIAALRRDLELLWARITFLEITREICDAAGRLAPSSRLRTLDAIHLATFRMLLAAAPDARMLTYDSRLLAVL